VRRAQKVLTEEGPGIKKNAEEGIITDATNDGGRDRDRTGDPLLAKQVLSQLSYSPTSVHIHFRAFAALRKL
jgi:hypothetical protein